MKLNTFKGQRLHGFLDFDVSFRDRLTFLTGINGSGKTTILNALVALIAPNLSALAGMSYGLIRLDLTDDAGKSTSIESTRTDDLVAIGVSGIKEKFTFLPYPLQPGIPPYRQQELEGEHYREVLVSAGSHPVIKFINSLPTPMFLGLDRRAKLAAEDRRFARPRAASMRNVFGGSLSASLFEAEDLARTGYRDGRFAADRVSAELQQKVLLSLITMAPEDYGRIAVPTQQEKNDLNRVLRDLAAFPTIFNLPAAEVHNRVSPFLEEMQRILSKIPKDANLDKDLAQEGRTPAYFGDLIRWSANKSQIKKIAVISDTVTSFNERRAAALKPFEDYKSLINGFIADSGKSIEVDVHGDIVVRIEGVEGDKDPQALSSGEAQIFVMLTNLAFNPAAQKANVFIIDEPELSLHVRWQELFVDSMMSANSKIQFIMATHSPSIILDRLDRCVDVVSKAKGKRRGVNKE